ncbi:MAG: amidohydrolase family protein, partial [Candidatus Dormibacteria bacterium]
FMDSAHQAFFKNEERLHRLSAPPSEIVRLQVRVTPYTHEDSGWIVRQAGEEVALFSSDFPHVEGGRNPMKRFSDSLAGLSPAALDRFFAGNFIDLMGQGLAPALRRPELAAA